MEACGGAHHWARTLQARGLRVKLIAPQFVKPYVKSNKNDANDAEAICEAISTPNMRFVAVKTVEQQDIQAVHRIRAGLIKQRTATGNRSAAWSRSTGWSPRGAASAAPVRSPVAGGCRERPHGTAFADLLSRPAGRSSCASIIAMAELDAGDRRHRKDRSRGSQTASAAFVAWARLSPPPWSPPWETASSSPTAGRCPVTGPHATAIQLRRQGTPSRHQQARRQVPAHPCSFTERRPVIRTEPRDKDDPLRQSGSIRLVKAKPHQQCGRRGD